MVNEKLIKDLDIAFTQFGDTKTMGFVEIAPADKVTEIEVRYKDDVDLDYAGSVTCYINLAIVNPKSFQLLIFAEDEVGERYVVNMDQDDIRFIALINSIIRSYEEK